MLVTILSVIIIAMAMVSVGYSGYSLWKNRGRVSEARASLEESMRRLAEADARMQVTLQNSTLRMDAMRLGNDWKPYETMMCKDCLIVGLVGKLAHDEDCSNAQSGWVHRG